MKNKEIQAVSISLLVMIAIIVIVHFTYNKNHGNLLVSYKMIQDVKCLSYFPYMV